MYKEILARIQELTNGQLEHEISQGPDAFHEGVFELYLNEAKKRGIHIDDRDLDIMMQIRKIEDTKARQKKRDVVSKIIPAYSKFKLIGVLLGIQQLQKDEEGNYLYKKMGYCSIIVPLIVWLLIFAGFLIVLLK